MESSPRGRAINLVSIALGAAPFAFAFVRLLETSFADLRMLAMALAAFLGALIIRTVARPRAGVSGAVTALSAVILGVSTALAGLTAMLLGAMAQFGVWAVSLVFGLCCAASYRIGKLEERQES